jgi:methylenetetrahydrofolate reductase (NADPH)
VKNVLDPKPRPVPGMVRLLARPRFELVPIRGVQEEFGHLPPGGTVSVTSSPRKGLEPTLELCAALAERGFRPVPHLAARLVESRGHLDEVAARLAGIGVREIFAVGGDSARPAGPFDSSLAMLMALAELGHRFERVGVAGYPERHPLIGADALHRILLGKQPYASYAVTQICFDPGVVVAWIRSIREAGFDLPVHVGVPGAVSRAKLLEISVKIGVGDSLRFLRKRGNIVGRLVGGGYRPDGFARGIAALLEPDPLGVAGFHINTFNQVERTERWRREILAPARSA